MLNLPFVTTPESWPSFDLQLSQMRKDSPRVELMKARYEQQRSAAAWEGERIDSNSVQMIQGQRRGKARVLKELIEYDK